jgi:hypothetical protein
MMASAVTAKSEQTELSCWNRTRSAGLAGEEGPGKRCRSSWKRRKKEEKEKGRELEKKLNNFTYQKQEVS